MKKTALSLVFAALTLGLMPTGSASAQNAVLAEIYGRGVHAFFCGRNDEATQLLSMAIDNGIQDPRAYYFRGLVAYSSGRIAEAEADWQLGAELEASGQTNPQIGRSLARFQGAGRIKLEEIRQQAQLNALAKAMKRSQQRYGELGGVGGSKCSCTPRSTVNRQSNHPSSRSPRHRESFRRRPGRGSRPA